MSRDSTATSLLPQASCCTEQTWCNGQHQAANHTSPTPLRKCHPGPFSASAAGSSMSLSHRQHSVLHTGLHPSIPALLWGLPAVQSVPAWPLSKMQMGTCRVWPLSWHMASPQRSPACAESLRQAAGAETGCCALQRRERGGSGRG